MGRVTRLPDYGVDYFEWGGYQVVDRVGEDFFVGCGREVLLQGVSAGAVYRSFVVRPRCG